MLKPFPSNVRFSCISCGICGREPKSDLEPMNGVVRFWDPDDGWRIAALCPWCWDEFGAVKPSPEDYAYHESRDDVCTGEPETDEDPLCAL